MIEYILILHVFGAILGVGGALASDLMFITSVRDGSLSDTELKFMRIGSFMVWSGLLILIGSGIFLLLSNPEYYLSSSKFLLKMTVVGVIFCNGIIFHANHIPRLHRHRDHHFPSSDEFMRARPWLLVSGALSFSSWLTAFILGSLRSIPLTYTQGLGIYASILAVAVIAALLLRSRILPHHKTS